jgi:hypothetical protein
MACSPIAAREPERDAGKGKLGDRALDRTLVVGTLIEATIQGPPSWRPNKRGETLTATVSADVRNARRWVVIPARSPVGLRIAEGGVALSVISVTVSGQVYPVTATVKDMVAAPGTRIRFVLPEGLTVARRLGGIP